MKNLWTPWRLEYVRNPEKQKREGECVFCQLLQLPEDEESLVLASDSQLYAVLNRYPYSNGHLMVIPREHQGDYLALSKEVVQKMAVWVQTIMSVLKKEFSPQGFNCGMNLGDAAGAGIAPHLHFHVVPRWQGDTNFMPVIAEIKCIPDHLTECYKRLKNPIRKALGIRG